MQNRKNLSFDDVIPQLSALYKNSLLVPFIGSGMSVPNCRTWPQFLTALSSETKNKVVENSFANAVIVAQEAVNVIRALPPEKQVEVYRAALMSNGTRKGIPIQCKELAGLYWPLVISTNYDDIFWSCFQDSYEKQVVLGRDADDCQEVLSSLDKIKSPILWAIQGFIGGQFQNLEMVIPDQVKRTRLAQQIVVGHHHYQRAINSSYQFRRSFAEVYRRRSIFFLGSGILEDYLVNLFGEIIFNQGCGPYPHFALIRKKDSERYNSLFMQRALGIYPIFYDEHEDVPKYLNKFNNHVKHWFGNDVDSNKHFIPKVFQDEIGFKLCVKSVDKTKTIEINIIKSDFPVPIRSDKSTCYITSLGKSKSGEILEGTQCLSLLEKACKNGAISQVNKSLWESVKTKSDSVFRYSDYPIYGVAARKLSVTDGDIRSLDIIEEVVFEALTVIEQVKFEVVNIGVLASGKGRIWHPIHPFAQMLRGIKRFLSSDVRSISRMNIFLVDPSIWAALIGRKIPIDTLLTSDLLSHNIEIVDASGSTERFSILIPAPTTLGEVFNACKLDPNNWRVEVYPPPNKLPDKYPLDMTVTSTMQMTFHTK